MAAQAYITAPFKNARGQLLQSYHFLPQEGNAVKGVLHYHHGLGDYALRNRELFSKLNDASYAVFTFDAHGHGVSEPLTPADRCAIQSFDHIVSDALQHVRDVVRPFMQDQCPTAPLFLMGSSMGAAATILMAQHPDIGDVRGLVLNAAAVDAVRTPVQRLMEPFAHLGNKLFPRCQLVPGLSPDKFMRDPAERAKRDVDAMLHKGGLKVCTACSMLDAFRHISECEANLSQPVLAVHGEKDEVCPIQPVRRLLDACASTDKTLEVLPEALHDTMHDFGKEDVMSKMLAWMDARA